MTAYADSSALLAWTFGQKEGNAAAEVLSGASRVFCSELTLFECDRVLRAKESTNALSTAEAGSARTFLAARTMMWIAVPLSNEVLAFGRRPFPREPVRSLDALHLGTALFLRENLPDLVVVTLDRRFAGNAALLGFRVLPGEEAAAGG